MMNNVNIYRKITVILCCFFAAGFMVSCDADLFRDELPDAGTQEDNILPKADFTYRPDALDFRKIIFTDLSSEATDYQWDFGGATSTDRDPTYTFEAGDGTYPVTLTASDKNGAADSRTIDVVVVDKFVPLPVTIVNGDFNDGQNDWKFSTFTGGTTSPYNSSSDGSFTNYDGSDNGAKTPGAKWTKSTSAGAYLSSNTRYAYQAIVVSPTTQDRTVKYILEYEYAIKTPAEQTGIAPGGNRIISEVLGAHFDDGADAVVSTPVTQFIANEAKGKTVHTLIEQEFTTNASGEMAIVFYAVTDVDVYIDNVKVYAAN